MKKLYILFTLSICVIVFQSGVKFSSQPPTGRTGATGNTCRGCHGSFPLNSNGSVSITGLPSTGYVPGTAYPFSLTITHNTADRKIWGFSIKAVNASGASVGTFSSNNSNAALNGSELSHDNALTTPAGASSFTYNNLSWTAPSASTDPVTFYYAAVAGNNADGNSGDYVYTGVTSFTLPVKLESFTAAKDRSAVLLQWKTANETNSSYFDIERSDDGQFFFSLGRVNTAGNNNAISDYSFADNKATSRAGKIFYRLKIVDKDGSFKYSNIISIKPNVTGFTLNNMYPVIVKSGDMVNVETYSDKDQTLYTTIFDESGRMLSNQKIIQTKGENNFKIQIPSQVQKGMMFVKFYTNEFQHTESLIVR